MKSKEILESPVIWAHKSGILVITKGFNRVKELCKFIESETGIEFTTENFSKLISERRSSANGWSLGDHYVNGRRVNRNNLNISPELAEILAYTTLWSYYNPNIPPVLVPPQKTAIAIGRFLNRVNDFEFFKGKGSTISKVLKGRQKSTQGWSVELLPKDGPQR